MDSLIHTNFIHFTVDENGPNISHLCYADDTILFSSCEPHSLGLLMNKLSKYEYISGQLINKNKSGFYVTFKKMILGSLLSKILLDSTNHNSLCNI